MIYFKDILLEIEADEEAEKIANEIGNEIDDIFKDELEKASKQQNEGILTVTALVLALPGMLNMISKVAQAISKKYYKGIDLKKQDPKKWYNVLDKFSAKADTYIGKPFDIILKPIISDDAKRKKVVNLLKGLTIATLSVMGSVDISKAGTAFAYLKGVAGPYASEIGQAVSEKSLPGLITFAKKTIPQMIK